MQRYFITLSYDGTRYHGWQIQPNGISVQETMEKALECLLRRPCPIVGAGRTDAGVHARCMTAHFDSPVPIDQPDDLVHRLNAYLPQDIAIATIYPVTPDLHARFSATRRSYEYRVCTAKDPFAEAYCLRVRPDTDFEAMNRAAALLGHYTDFTSFSKLHTDVKTNNCKIFEAEWKQVSPTEWVFCISADRFLRNMVRAIVGTLLQVGAHKIPVEGVARIIESRDRCAAGESVPAKALFLTEVRYD